MAPAPVITRLALQDTSLLNAVADAQHVDTSSLRDCTISTTINDIRFGSYTSNAQTHEACVIFFCFDVLDQRKKTSQRIKELNIKISLFLAEAVDKVAPNSPADRALEVRYRNPDRGRTKPSNMRVKKETTLGAQAGYQFAGLNGSYSVVNERDVVDWGLLESYMEKKLHLHFRLSENKMLEEGVPGKFECAVVVRTDGMPFKIGAFFKAKIPYLGKLWTKEATTEALVEETMLNRRIGTRGDEDSSGLTNMDSERFLQWVESKAKNDWLVVL